MEKLLKEVLDIDSPSGYTSGVEQFIIHYINNCGYEAKLSKKGAVYVKIDANKNETIALSAHMDTLGLIVKSINSDGTLNVSEIGAPILSTINGEYCTIYTRDNKNYRGTILNKNRAIHVHKDSREKVVVDNMIVRIDEIVKCSDDVLNLGINVGDFICYDPKVEFVNGFVKSRFLDDKAGVVALLKLLQDIDEEKLNKNVIIYFSPYEEVGHGGAWAPEVIDELIAVDMGCVGEDLNGNEYSVSICVKDGSGPYDYELTTKLINVAKELNVDYAIDVYPMYSSDGSSFLRAGNDAKVALIGPGVDASHGMERTTLKAIENTSKIIMKYITKKI